MLYQLNGIWQPSFWKNVCTFQVNEQTLIHVPMDVFLFFLYFNSSCVFANFGIVWLMVSFLFENCVQIKSLIWFFEFMSPCHVAQIVILLRLCLSIKGYWSKVVIRSYIFFVFYLHDMYHHALELQNQFSWFFPHLFLKCLNTVKLETRHLHCQPFYAEIGDIHSLFLILITRIGVEFFKKKPRHFYIILFQRGKVIL